MTESQKEEVVRVRPFADFLREHNKGVSHDELSEALQLLVNKVRDTGKKGVLVFAISLEMNKDGETLLVGDNIKVKLPEHDRSSSIFFADREGNLVRDDPRQTQFKFLRDASGVYLSAGEDVDPTTGEITTKGAGA